MNKERVTLLIQSHKGEQSPRQRVLLHLLTCDKIPAKNHLRKVLTILANGSRGVNHGMYGMRIRVQLITMHAHLGDTRKNTVHWQVYFLYIDFELLTHRMVTHPFSEDLLTLNQATKYFSDMLYNLSLRLLSRIHNKLLSLLSQIRPQFQFPKTGQFLRKSQEQRTTNLQ